MTWCFTPVTYQAAAQTPVNTANPILFVTQVPIPNDFVTVTAVFGNQQPAMQNAGRGGDLYIRYPDGTLKNLTAAGGYGVSGFQGDKAIAVREPSVHWSGAKALFSMVIGAPPRYKYLEYYWQIYEITGLGRSDTPVITKVPNQPANYNNVSPMYGSDDRIVRVTASGISIRSSTNMKPCRPTPACGAWIRKPAICSCSTIRLPAPSRRFWTASAGWYLRGGIICSATNRLTPTRSAHGTLARSTIRAKMKIPCRSTTVTKSFRSRARSAPICWRERI
jgi:hypothetical protein